MRSAQKHAITQSLFIWGFMPTRLAEMLTTRLCHDLTGPIGAVNNGAEFLQEDNFEMQGDALDLIISSAKEAVARVQFYRRAYGRINSNGEANLEEHRDIVALLLENGSITLDWPDEYTDGNGASISRRMGRVLMNMVIFVAGAMVKGGTLSIRIEETEQESVVSIRATSQMIKIDPELKEVLQGNTPLDDLTPKTVQAHFLYMISDEINAALTLEDSHGECQIRAVKPNELNA